MPNLRRRRLFDDTYNIERERRDLRDMLIGPVDPHDPRLPRFQELLRREAILRERAIAHAPAADAADPSSSSASADTSFSTAIASVAPSAPTAPPRPAAHPASASRRVPAQAPLSDAAVVEAMPPLANAQEEAMILHTKDAYRLFVGRQADLNNHVQPTYGARYCAFALRNLWTLSNHDNPYADWALINIDAELDALKRFIRQQIDLQNTALDTLRQNGLEVAVLQSSRPQRTVLQFSSPYAYAVIQLLLDFDRYVRIVRTLGRRSALSDQDVTKAIRTVARKLRHTFLNVIRYARVLAADKLKSHTRADFGTDVPPAAIERRQILEQIYGAVPANILDGTLRPRHSKRAKLTMKQRDAAAATDEPARTKLRHDVEDDLL